ncbi:LysM peptidoglycan-binding domain-containing protein [Metallumcola ferriviriculae]|uniref:LysM peptidoglycan-binding domain-containing protein n=1 Tax=Metallumcola ferriviriculae TaxID=3039180 RepID=A0AAU0UMX0_9FIRM|nr:LysM peptidoglycan-binding domain-containing protein [Desulfitibacteraceae bacterium MK1]
MFRQIEPRVPSSCPLGFQARYTVVRGDTMFLISQRFRVTLVSLITANPHISNLNLIVPGDVLCVPEGLAAPCCVVLTLQEQLQPGADAAAAAFVHSAASTGLQEVSVVAVLPPPEVLGEFNGWLAQVLIPEVNGFGNQLFATPVTPPTWATTFALPRGISVSAGSRVEVRPFNTDSGVSGPVVLQGSLRNCT